MLSCEFLAPNSMMTKHWCEVLGVVSSMSQQFSSLSRLQDYLNRWKIDRAHGPRDSVGYPGANAEFLIEDGELRVYKTRHDHGKKKLMAKVKITDTTKNEQH